MKEIKVVPILATIFFVSLVYAGCGSTPFNQSSGRSQASSKVAASSSNSFSSGEVRASPDKSINEQFAWMLAGIAIDSSDNIYVLVGAQSPSGDVNGGNHIEKFDPSGKYITQWGGEGSADGQFTTPMGISVDSSGNVYVADAGNSRVQKFDSSGKYITQWVSSGSTYISVDSSDNVYVADNNNMHITKFDRDGKYITRWGGYGGCCGQFAYIADIAVDSTSNVYVADSGNIRIQKFDASGKYLTQWGGEGIGNGQFESVMHVAVDSSGNVYVAEDGNQAVPSKSRIQKFDANGKYITQWSIGVGQVEAGLVGLAVDSSGNIYVADAANKRIQKFSAGSSGLSSGGARVGFKNN